MRSGLSGLRAWLFQRISAIYLGSFLICMIVFAFVRPHVDAEQWHTWLTQPFILLSLALFVLMMLVHAWIGVRDVIVDYVHPLSLRLVLLSTSAFFLISSGLWAAQILLSASLE